MLNCQKFLSKCKACCCGPVPFPKGTDLSKAVRPIKEQIEMADGMMIFITDNLYCPFLSETLECVIYDSRPEVCRLYGNETHPCLVCVYQNKDGNKRSRPETREILKQHNLHSMFERFRY